MVLTGTGTIIQTLSQGVVSDLAYTPPIDEITLPGPILPPFGPVGVDVPGFFGSDLLEVVDLPRR